MELDKLSCFFTQGRELPYFWSSTIEVQSFTTLKLQAAFPTLRLSFFDKAIFTQHFLQPTYIANIKKILKTVFLYHFLTWFTLCIIYIVYLGGLLLKSRPWAVWLLQWFFAKPSKLAKNWSWHTKYIIEICEHGSKNCDPVPLLMSPGLLEGYIVLKSGMMLQYRN